MFSDSISMPSSFFTIVVISLLHTIPSESTNASDAISFSPALATWSGLDLGFGTGGSCVFGQDLANAPYYGMTSTVNQNLFHHKVGCGNCYEVKCTENPACSGNPITVTITKNSSRKHNNTDAVHFDLSGKAFGSLAKSGQEDLLREAGRINIQYQRVQCSSQTPITFKMANDSNFFRLGFAIEMENGEGVSSAEILPPFTVGWFPMSNFDKSETWWRGLPKGMIGPYSVRITTIESRRIILAPNAIPGYYTPGKSYRTSNYFLSKI